jgi:hypothetical protein
MRTSCRSVTVGLLFVAAALTGSLANAQEIDFTGEWRPIYHEDGPERIPGPDLGDYSGIPINDAARLRADSYSPERIVAVTENNCRQHGGDYSMRGLANLRIMRELDPVTQQAVAFHTRIGFHTMDRTVYLDGRPHPGPQAPHTWQGFSTAEWKGNQLAITTTHLKENYHRRNGIPSGPNRTFTERWVRHGDVLTVVTIVDDPEMLTERFVRSQSWMLDPGQRTFANPCEYGGESTSEPGTVPAYLPGANPFLNEFADRWGLPRSGARGGAASMYPEFRLNMEKPATTPEKCTLYCKCMNDGAVCPDGP